ncbi:Uncharacterised protein [Mycobacterium tuberculosis]|nr:Uncharacterised protein [Mycobacterium tuberculosis]
MSTEPTITASTGEPNTALAIAPSASIGVNGSDNSARTALVNCQSAFKGAWVICAPRFAVCRPPASARAGACSSGDGKALRTCSTDIACHS